MMKVSINGNQKCKGFKKKIRMLDLKPASPAQEPKNMLETKPHIVKTKKPSMCLLGIADSHLCDQVIRACMQRELETTALLIEQLRTLHTPPASERPASE